MKDEDFRFRIRVWGLRFTVYGLLTCMPPKPQALLPKFSAPTVDAGVDATHNPEFTSVEAYQVWSHFCFLSLGCIPKTVYVPLK